MKKMHRLATSMLCGLLAWPGFATADAVTDWNEIAAGAVTAGRPGPIGIVDIALVQAAVHDAVQATEQRFEPYYAEVPGASGSSSAAAAAAAHAVLVGMYPAQQSTLDTTYFNYLANNGLNGDPGLAVGEAVAARILPLRRVNPNPLPAPFIGGTGVGQWRPTDSLIGTPPAPAPFSAMASPWMGAFDPFTLTGPARYRAPPPPAVTSAQYTADYNEVKALGSFASTARTPAQTDMAYFWADNYLLQWNRALRAIAIQNGLGVGDGARLLALANLATADAIITSWDSKLFYFYWRPVTAIQEGEFDGNPDTVGDPSWTSLINNPNYPDYTSGANCFTGAMTGTLQKFFGRDKMNFSVTTGVALATTKTRNFTRFSQAMSEVVEARILLGIHFRFADTGGRTQGQKVAAWAHDHFLRPIKKPSAPK